MTNSKTFGAVREREREPYFTKINKVLFNDFSHIKVFENNKKDYKNKENSITMLVSKLDTG